MRVIENIRECPADLPPTVLTVGSFDGVHRGHQRILAELLGVATERGQTAAVLTMRPHPRELFSPDHAPNLLTCDKMKTRLIEAAGLDLLLFVEFTREVADQDHGAFVDEVLCGLCNAQALIVGHDFCFGKDALGDYDFLKSVGPQRGFEVRQVPPLIVDGERVSSTLVRERVLQGDLEKAELFLGRKYAVLGTVIPGHGIGARLGFPTANIEPRHSAVPAQGVYIAEAVLGDCRRPAAVNIGIAPTIRQKDIVIEAHLVDFDRDIVGADIEIVFHKRLRSEKKFQGRAELAEQIARDVAAVREHFDTPG